MTVNPTLQLLSESMTGAQTSEANYSANTSQVVDYVENTTYTPTGNPTLDLLNQVGAPLSTNANLGERPIATGKYGVQIEEPKPVEKEEDPLTKMFNQVLTEPPPTEHVSLSDMFDNATVTPIESHTQVEEVIQSDPMNMFDAAVVPVDSHAQVEEVVQSDPMNIFNQGLVPTEHATNQTVAAVPMTNYPVEMPQQQLEQHNADNNVGGRFIT